MEENNFYEKTQNLLVKSDTELPVNIVLDVNGQYKLKNIKKCIWFQINKLDIEKDQTYCPIFLDGEIPEKKYKKLIENNYSDLTSEDIEKLKIFVKNNNYGLSLLADNKITIEDFLSVIIKKDNMYPEAITKQKSFLDRKIKKTNEEISSMNEKVEYYRDKCESLFDSLKNINEYLNGIVQNYDSLIQMANYRKSKTGLPVNIWIDQSGNYKLHNRGKIILFQINKNSDYETSRCVMTLEGFIDSNELKKAKENENYDITEEEIQQVRNFVLNNRLALELVAEQKIYEDIFDNTFIKGGYKAEDKEILNCNKKLQLYIEN